MMKLLMHVRTEKTATASIQAWLEANCAGRIRQRRVVPPEQQRVGASFQDSVDPYFLALRITILRERRMEEVATAAKTNDRMAIAFQQMQNCLLSTQEVDGLADILGWRLGFLTVFCHLRIQSDMHRSMYSIVVRVGYTGPMEGFGADIDETSLYHDALADRWTSAFVPDRLLLRDYACGKLHDAYFAKVALSGTHSAVYRVINRIQPVSGGQGGLKRGNARAIKDCKHRVRPYRCKSETPCGLGAGTESWRGIKARFAARNLRFSEANFYGSLFATERQNASEQCGLLRTEA